MCSLSMLPANILSLLLLLLVLLHVLRCSRHAVRGSKRPKSGLWSSLGKSQKSQVLRSEPTGGIQMTLSQSQPSSMPWEASAGHSVQAHGTGGPAGRDFKLAAY